MTGIEEGAAAAAAAGAASSAAAAGTTAAAAGTVAAGTAAAAAAGTGATLAGTLASLSPYIAAGSGLLSAVGSIASGKAQAAALQRNASVDQINAGTALSTSEADAQRLQIRAQRSVATGVNNVGASGVDLSTGSPLDVMSDAAAQGALDSEISRWRGTTQANAYLTNSGTALQQADQTQEAGLAQAGTTLLTAGARYAAGRLPMQVPS